MLAFVPHTRLLDVNNYFLKVIPTFFIFSIVIPDIRKIINLTAEEI